MLLGWALAGAEQQGRGWQVDRQASDNMGWSGASGPWHPSVLSHELVVLVTVSRLWLGITCYTSLGISGVQQDPPPVGPSVVWGQGGAGPGMAHLPRNNAQMTVCVT